MSKVYRICGKKYHPMDATGAALSEEGRWHKKGDRVLYCSYSLATCVLEQKVNGVSFTTIRELQHFSEVEIPDDIPEEVVPDSFYVVGWQKSKTASQDLGSDWYHKMRSPILRVKSSVLATETNLIINTLHPEFTRISFQEPVELELDPRLS